MPTFQESDLTFSFPHSWTVRKYDAHRFYQGLSGYGLKAVDFIILLPDGRLCLAEVKNYHPRQNEHGEDHPITRKKAAKLAKSLARKYTDSLHAIRIIREFYQRKWYHRWGYFLYGRLGYWTDLQFWHEAARRAEGQLPVTILLWLETPKAAKRYRTKIYAHLHTHIAPEKAQLILGGNGFSPLVGLEAKFNSSV
ncbi:MAG: hypothetical protein AAFQ37_11540 [Bacteroidota bacterium]